MKLHILSDLHIEFADFELPETDADVIVLAGDIGVGMGGLEWVMKQRASMHFIYVPGNHELLVQASSGCVDLLTVAFNQPTPKVPISRNGARQDHASAGRISAGKCGRGACVTIFPVAAR